jgi:hypothetical protein
VEDGKKRGRAETSLPDGPGGANGHLSPAHRKILLEGSAIAPEVVEARGYRTVGTKAELERLGFGRSQRNAPGLLIPIFGPAGSVALYQFRPDEPRISKGKPVKYETPAGSRMALDVPPPCREKIGDPGVSLFITEGVKKGDALASRGLCAAALIGVWNWRGSNEYGGKVALPEWESVALNGRRIYVVFDSDVMLKKEVHSALARLKGFLESRGAKVAPIYLPAGERGEKQGADDYLAAGGTVDGLLQLAAPELREAPGEDRKQTQGEALIGYADAAELFHSPDGEAFATVEVDGHQETWPLKSRRFTQHLLRSFWEENRKAPSAQALADARATIAARAAFDGPEREVSFRVAKYSGGRDSEAVYVDLCNAGWEAVEVTASGWRVVPSADVPVKFVRKDNAAPLPRPVPGGSVESLRGLLNVRTDEDFRLLVAWLVGVFNPDGPYPVLVLQGEQGSAKSTTVRVLRSVTDPAVEPLRAPPRDERDLAIAASGNRTPALDNLSGIRPWLSDALCRLATGGGFATRELYSDDREVLFSQKRPVILNGIDSLAVAGDLRDRSIVVELPPIPPDKKRTERDFYAELHEVRPKALGALLDAVSAALRERDSVRLPSLPRMADFAVWATAAEGALGWEAGSFMEAYAGNRSAATELALDEDPVAVAVRRLLDKQEEWSGTATELLARLGELIDEETRRSKSWPAAPNALSNRLKRIAPALRETGIEYGDGRLPGGSRKRAKTLMRKPEKDRPSRPHRPAEEESPANHGYGPGTMVGEMGRSRDSGNAGIVPDKHSANGCFRDGLDGGDGREHASSEPEREVFAL